MLVITGSTLALTCSNKVVYLGWRGLGTGRLMQSLPPVQLEPAGVVLSTLLPSCGCTGLLQTASVDASVQFLDLDGTRKISNRRLSNGHGSDQ